MFKIIIAIVGLFVSALYVGFLAYSIGAVPLWIITVGTFVLAVRELLVEFGSKNE
ncbi:MAG: hypothetical protein WB783_01985 [Arenicellales bacterium]|jgi:hypothetical protein